MTVSLAVLAFGVLAWVPVAMALRGVASVDRARVSWYRHQPVHAHYRRPRSNGVVDHFKNRYATLNLGIYTVTSTGRAFATTGIGLALAPVALVINRWVASVHSRWAHHLLAVRIGN